MLTVRRFADQHESFRLHGVDLVQVFHSPAEALSEFVTGEHALPFPILSDPQRTAYAAFGLRNSWWSVLRPAGWRRGLRAGKAGYKPRLRDMWRDGIRTFPGDFLIDGEGQLEHCHYGQSFSDSIQPDEARRWLSLTD